MFVRLLFLLLLALNIGVGAWLVFGDGQVVARPPVTDPGVPELKLLSERDGPGSGQAAGREQPVSARAAKAGDRCLAIGPFDTLSDTRDVIDALSAHVPRIQYRQEQTTQSSGWWVYLPPLPSRDQALGVARQLTDKGISDYYVVTAGDRQNTISLGLYHDQGNALRRQQQLVALGFHPQVKQRTETLPQYWVDIALPADPGFHWHQDLKRDDVKAHSINCF